MPHTFSSTAALSRRVLACVAASVLALPAIAGQVQLAVAANFAAPMKRIAQAFDKDTGHKTIISYGATGKLYAQITNGAPFDVLLSADETTPARLEKDGLVVAGSRITYATGRLVLWSANPALVDSRGAVLTGQSGNDFKHLAIAAPKLAPYGAAAMQALTSLGVLPMLQPKLVMGENIGQTFSMVSSGNAELGFVAMSQVFEDGKLKAGSAWVVPANLHSALRQDAVLLVGGKSNPAALQLMAFLKSAPAKAIMNSFGYE